MKLKRGLQKECGVVMVMVLLLTLIMSIFVIGIISTNVSEVISGVRQVDRIKAEAAARAADALAYYKHYNGDLSATSLTLPMDTKTFSATVNPGVADSGPNATDPYSTTVNY